MIISDNITDAFEYLAYASRHLSSLINDNDLSRLETIRHYINEYHKSKTKYKKQIQQIDGYLDSLEDRFSQTLNTVSLAIDSNTISKLRTCLGDMQDAILSKIPKGSQMYNHLQKEFPNL